MDVSLLESKNGGGVRGVHRFERVSIILPVMNETFSLDQTVEIILAEARADIEEIIFVIGNKTGIESVRRCESYLKRTDLCFKLHRQTLPFLGGAIRECFDLASGSHVIMMASDLETDPHTVKDLIAMARQEPSAVITASRWMGGSRFVGYQRFKYVANFIFQKIFSILYKNNLSDMTFGFRCFPTGLVKAIQWEELKHPFLFETVIKPLKLGVRVLETPTSWEVRKEGSSNNAFLSNFLYFFIGFRVLFRSKASLLKKGGRL